jgi:excisionase family DNA binding protein/PAS domain S-box-containing protein
MTHPALTVEFLLGFMESYPAALIVFELDGTIVYINQLGCEGAMRSREELTGSHIQDLVADPAQVEGFIGRIILKGYMEGEYSIAQGDGNTVSLRLAGLLVRDSAGKPMGIVGMALAANTALAQPEMEQSVRRVISQLPDARMLTVEEVANELRVSKETVRRWVRSGQLPCIKLPRGIRIPSEVIKDLILTNLQRELGESADATGDTSGSDHRTDNTESNVSTSPPLRSEASIDSA